MSSDEQVSAFREKFLSVVEPVLASEDESNILTLFSFLSNTCRQKSLLVPFEESGISSNKDVAELTCWLLSHLLLIRSSPKVYKGNVELQVSIFQLVGTRNVDLFPLLVKDYVQLGIDGANILYDGESVAHQCFSGIISSFPAVLVPKTIQLSDNDDLDQLIGIVIKVLGKIGCLLNLYYSDHLDSVWTLVGLCLEAGSLFLKGVALESIYELSKRCRMTTAPLEVQDYILQVIGGCIVGLSEGEFQHNETDFCNSKESLNILEENLCSVVKHLHTCVHELPPVLSQDLLMCFGKFVSSSPKLSDFDNNLIEELLTLGCRLIDIHADSFETEGIKSSLDEWIEKNIQCIQIVEPCLKKFLSNELNQALPSHEVKPSGSKKRKLEESREEPTILNVAHFSSWWTRIIKSVEENLTRAQRSNDEEEFRSSLALLVVYFDAASDVVSELPPTQVFLKLFSPNLMTSMTSFFESLSKAPSQAKAEGMLTLMLSLIFLLAKTEDSKSCSELSPAPLWHNWAAIGSFPWLSSEMNHLDLRLDVSKKFAPLSSQVSWTSDIKVQRKCIGILALLPPHIAPKWRCQVIRHIVSERNPCVLPSLIQWFPIFVHHIAGAIAPLMGEVYGSLLKLQNEEILRNLAASLSLFFCAVLGQTCLVKSTPGPLTPKCLKCKTCSSMDATIPRVLPSPNSQPKVDQAMVLRFFHLAASPFEGVVAAFVTSLPSIARHCFLSPTMFSKLLCLLQHKEDRVVDAFCESLPVLLFSNEGLTEKGDASEENALEAHLLRHLGEMTGSNGAFEVSTRSRLSALKAMDHLIRMKKTTIGSSGSLLIMILHCLISKNREVVANAQILVLKWSKSLGVTPKKLYLKYKRTSAQALAEVIQVGDVERVMSLLAQVFRWSDGVCTSSGAAHQNRYNATASFVNSQLHFLLPPLALRSMKDKKPNLLQQLSASLGSRLRDMIIDHFQHILAYLVFYSPEKEKELVLEFVSTTTDIHITDIRKCSVQSQVNELVLGLHEHRDSIIKEFVAMKELESEMQIQKDAGDCQWMVVQFLAPRLLGILGYLDGKIISSTATYREKESALLSLSDLLMIMGPKHISPVARKVLATLKTALKIRNPKFIDACSRGWTSFLNNLDENSLNRMIEEVILLVLPLTKERPQTMAPVLKKLLLGRASIKPLLGRLPSLPSHPSLAEINAEITEQRVRMQKQAEENVVSVLPPILNGLRHESLDVRIHNLKRLKEILSENLDDIHHLILDSDRADPTLSNIFTILLGQCRENENDLQVYVAECLGLLGAIDPARLYTPDNRDEVSNKLHLSIDCEPFVVDLILELSRAFLSATEASTQTCALYALQEVLRIYGINSSQSDSSTPFGMSVWKQLPADIKEILEPLYNSKYRDVSKRGQYSDSNIPLPVYGSKLSSSFHQWLTNWGCSLINLLVTDKVVQVFLACKPIMKRDKNTSLFLLPFLLICVLTESSEHHPKVSTEILAILTDDSHSGSQSREAKAPPGSQSQQLREAEQQLPSKELHDLAVQTVFSSLDHLKRWTLLPKQKEPSNRPAVKKILEFLDQIPANIMAETAFHCQSYSRALMYIECHINKNQDQMKNNLQFLQSIYVALDDPDGVDGVAAIRQEEPTLNEQIIQYEANGRLQDALGCYERLCIEQNSNQAYEGLLKCYLSLDQPQSVLNISQGLLTSNHYDPAFNECRVEAAWRLGQWDRLENYMKGDSGAFSWGIGIGEILHAARSEESAKFRSALKNLRIQLMSPLSALSIDGGSYQRAYPYVLKLHLLCELEEMMTGLLKISPLVNVDAGGGGGAPSRSDGPSKPSFTLNLKALTDRWSRRLSLVQTSHRFLEPLISFRRTLLQFGRDWTKHSDPLTSFELENEIKLCWIQSAKVARKAGHYQPGERAFLGTGNGREVFVERAKWYWIKGDQRQAVTTLKRGIEAFFPNYKKYKQDCRKETEEDRLACAQAKLLLARYSEDSAILDTNTIKSYYRDVNDIIWKSEDGHFNLAMYYDRIHSTCTLDQKHKSHEWILHIVQSFGKSLNYGCKHVYQSMPRLLGLWLDHGAFAVGLKKNAERVNQTYAASNYDCLNRMNEFIATITEALPTYTFFIALPQLISRICHSHEGLFKVLCKLIAKILCTYPQQAMWHMVAVSKSSYRMRLKRCQEVFESAKEKDPSMCKFISDVTKLSDLFLELSNKNVEKNVHRASLSKLLRSLPRLLSDPNFSQLILPLQQQMTVVLPPPTKNSTANQGPHNPFPNSSVFLTGIEDQIEIMQSLQKPKKMTLQGSDGNKYIMMCKPKDDLRKDNRLMDFTSFVNRLLMRDPESRRRSLHIRTYTVVPLNDECGLIEWVPNLKPMRAIIYELYKEVKMGCSNSELAAIANQLKTNLPLEKKREIFLSRLVPRHPSVLQDWFLRTFMEPHSWLKARLSYCRTNAVMSMVGYILGLGDRHGENILLDSSSGDTVHVDFNCLFNKGESFDWPERVPFRLTHNMTSAMGSTRYEGVYRKACEVTMRVMHQEKDSLMSILKPFIHDPLVEWNRKDNHAKNTGEINNEKAQYNVKEIESRLLGKVSNKRKGTTLLSVQGQVNALIEEATNIDNLCQMYIGWAPHM